MSVAYCPEDCQGCACHISAPCFHCTEHLHPDDCECATCEIEADDHNDHYGDGYNGDAL